jgi:S-adenosylmethionine:tRNA ribosyltransferase-isomerase
VLDRRTGAISLGRFPDLLGFLNPGDALVLNETRVIAARLFATRAGTGGRVELLFVRPAADGAWWAMAKPGRSLRPGGKLEIEGADAHLEVRVCSGGLYALAYDGDWAALMAAAGHVPLPPYIRRPDAADDRERYQTVYARVPGAIAAPTAGLHWTPGLLDAARARGVDIVRILLHVGPGTFKPVTASEPSAHVLDPEYYEISREAAGRLAAAHRGGGRVIAVGTTVARTLETGAALLSEDARAAGEVVAAGAGWTDRLIVPPYAFRGLDGLVTNFHLPRSSLLFLVSALGGREAVLAAYRRAIDEGFRFYSYGDAMFIA